MIGTLIPAAFACSTCVFKLSSAPIKSLNADLSILFILILIIILKLTNYRKKIIYLTFISFLVYSYTDNCIVNNRYWYLFMFIIGCFKYFDRKEENALL